MAKKTKRGSKATLLEVSQKIVDRYQQSYAINKAKLNAKLSFKNRWNGVKIITYSITKIAKYKYEFMTYY